MVPKRTLSRPPEAALEVGDKGERALGRGIAPVKESVDDDGNAGAGDEAGKGGELVLVRMHASRREQAQEVGPSLTRLEPGDEVA